MATYQNSIANLGVRLVITHQSPDIANNRTTINYSAYVYKTNGNPWNQLSQTPMKLTINGQNLINISNGNYNLNGVSQQLIKSGTLTIPHNSDGTKSFSFSWNVNFTSTGYGYGNVTTSGTYTLPTIPRTSTFSVTSTMNTGTNYTLTINRSSTSFTHDVTYTVGGVETNVATSTTATSVTVNIPHDLFNRYPSNSTVTGTINVKTKNGSSVIGVRSQTVNINLPASPDNPSTFEPTVTGLSVENTRYAPMTASNQLIRGISRLTLKASGAKGAYSSTIVSYEFRYERANGNYEGVVSSSTNSFQYGVFLFPDSGSEDLTAEVRVKDSRGRYSAWKKVPSAFRVHFYQPPSIGNIRVWRTGANNTSLNVERSYKVTPLYSGGGTTNNNTALLSFQTRELGGKESTNTGAKSSTMSLTNSTATLSGTFAANKSYEVRAVLKDSIQTVYGSWIRVSTESLPMTLAPNGIGVGKAHSGGSYNLEVGSGGASIEGGLTVDGNLQINGDLTPTFLNAGTDLNNIKSPGFYFNPSNAIVQTMSNTPTGNSFSMLVMKHAGVVQILTEYMTSGAKTFIRNYYNNTWGSWTIVMNENDVKTLLAGSPYNFDNNSFINMIKAGQVYVSDVLDANTFLHGIVWCHGRKTGTPPADGLLYAYKINAVQATQIYFGIDNKLYQRQRAWETGVWGAWSNGR